MPQIIFETKRVRARHLEHADIEALLEVYGDAEAMRWVGDGRPLTRALCLKWLEITEENYRRRGYGMAALEDTSCNDVIGFCGLVHPGDQVDVEIKYALKRRFWGMGLATEAVRAMLEYGATVKGLHRIIATTAPENSASQKVLVKAGMVPSVVRSNENGSATRIFVWHHAESPLPSLIQGNDARRN
ncbi:MAG TPA: GNAT family N-acetyltransferase [Burkholderiaceae bacterium]|nr:GNAT family N-acetyltransferase [Burkholderiaceae bacterium]